MTPLLCLLICTLVVFVNVEGYKCKNKTCIIHCSSNANNVINHSCSNTVIKSGNAELLKIICDGDSICHHLDIHCPRNTNATDCHLSCNGNAACNDINFYTFNSNSSIQCGDHPMIRNKITTKSICSNITISSTHKKVSSTFQSLPQQHNITSQNITINCSASLSLAPTCSNITLENITANITPNSLFKNLFIICDCAYFICNTSSNIPCYNFTIIHNNIQTDADIQLNISIDNYFGLKHLYIMNTTANALNINNYNDISNVYIASQSINEFTVHNNNTATMHNMSIQTVNMLMNNGVMSYINIHKFQNIIIGSSGQLISSNISSLNMNNTINVSGQIKYCTFCLNQDINHNNNVLTLFDDGILTNSTINVNGILVINVNGIFAYNTINGITVNTNNMTNDFMNVMTLNLNDSSSWINNTIIAYYTELLEIKTSSLFSGTIYTNNGCNNFSLQCNNKLDIDKTCKNLTLYTAPMYTDDAHNVRYRTYLDCVGYGCQYISIWSLNGLNDVYLSATECPCTVDCIDNCIGEWNIYCSNTSHYDSSYINFNEHSIFTDDECTPDKCCGDIINQSEAYFVCSPNLYQNVVCIHNVGLDIALITSLISAGVISLFFVFLVFRCLCRKAKNDELKKELQKKREMEKDKKKESKKHCKKKVYKLQNTAQQEPLLPSLRETEKIL